MNNVTFNERGGIKVTASSTSSRHDFDFLQGKFKVHHKKLKSRLSHSNEWFEFDGAMEMRTILMGIGNVENHTMTTLDGKPVEGFALRLFDLNTRLWSIYWADSQNGKLDIPVVGSFDGNKGYFFANDHFNGQEVLLQFEWDIINPSQPVWKQAFSVDEGNTWEWNWYMYFTKWEPALNPEDLARFFIVRANAGDVDGLAALYEPDAALVGPQGQVMIGTEAIRNFYAGLLKGRPIFQAGDQHPAIRHANIALTSSRLTNGTVTAEIARQQPDSTWLWIIDQPAIAQETP